MRSTIRAAPSTARLLDSELLAEVYIDLIGARQSQLILAAPKFATSGPEGGRNAAAAAHRATRARISDEDRAAHRAFVATLGDKAIWNEYLGGLSEAGIRFLTRSRISTRLAMPLSSACLRGLSGGGLARHVLAIQADEIDGIEHQRREAAIADRRRDDFAREREQQPRAFDHDHRVQVFLRHVHDTEHAGIGQVEAEQHLAAVSALPSIKSATSNSFSATLLALTLIWMLIAGCCACGHQRGRRVRIFERQVLGILRQHVQLGGRSCLGGRTVAVGHRNLSWSISSEQGPVASEFAHEGRKGLCRANGYHRAASFHKDDGPATAAAAGSGPGARGLKDHRRVSEVAKLKLLNMRDFRASSGFPLAAKTGYNTMVANGREHRLVHFHRHGLSCQGAPLAGQVLCLHAADLFHEVICAVL